MIQEDIRVKDIREKWQRWFDARADWDTQAREDIDFYLGSHFSVEEANALAVKIFGAKPGAVANSPARAFRKAMLTWAQKKYKGKKTPETDLTMRVRLDY